MIVKVYGNYPTEIAVKLVREQIEKQSFQFPYNNYLKTTKLKHT